TFFLEMDCNKDEAIKAKEIAEKKMQDKDFVGAKKFATKALNLYPNLAGLPKILTVCNVHCSAEQKFPGNDMDWYGILQVEVTSDEAAIKTQYRKLALLLHPDKNNLQGAEAAFKLVGEAHRVLTDRAKRSLFDMKYKALKERSQLPQHGQQRANVRKQPGVGKSYGNISRTHHTSVNIPSQPAQPAKDRPTFWTACPSCTMRYQYYIDVLNKSLRCQCCTKPFTAYNLNVQGVPAGVPLGAPWQRPVVPQRNVVGQDGHKVGSQSTVPDLPPKFGFQGPKAGTSNVNGILKTNGKEDRGVNKEDRMEGQNRQQQPAVRQQNVAGQDVPEVGSQSTVQDFPPSMGFQGHKAGTSNVNGISKTKGEEHRGVNKEDRMEGQNRRKFEVELQNAGRKRRKPYSESSESLGTETSSSSSDEIEIPDYIKGSVPVDQSSGIPESLNTRRSARQKRQVVYSEDINDDIVGSQWHSKPSTVSENQSEATSKEDESKTVKPKESAPMEPISHNGNVKVELCKSNAEDAVRVENDEDESEIDGIKVPDPEFYVFDNVRKEDCFKNDQMWAVYDDADGMPRFYALIRKVFSPAFRVRFTWLEAKPDGQDEIVWADAQLPVSCGKFKLGKTEIVEGVNMFSHTVGYEKGSGRGSFELYPRKGETWAVFKNWDLKWSLDPDSCSNFEFDFVEVLSDYDEQSGIDVAYLEKVNGFVCLFQPKNGKAPFQIPPKELFRFSHMVPSYRMTGEERDGVPERSFELDPASLPANLLDPKKVGIWFTSELGLTTDSQEFDPLEENMPLRFIICGGIGIGSAEGIRLGAASMMEKAKTKAEADHLALEVAARVA
ncbi:hypothetical protein IFM89_031224, partial [Coptis chinensis]